MYASTVRSNFTERRSGVRWDTPSSMVASMLRPSVMNHVGICGITRSSLNTLFPALDAILVSETVRQLQASAELGDDQAMDCADLALRRLAPGLDRFKLVTDDELGTFLRTGGTDLHLSETANGPVSASILVPFVAFARTRLAPALSKITGLSLELSATIARRAIQSALASLVAADRKLAPDVAVTAFGAGLADEGMILRLLSAGGTESAIFLIARIGGLVAASARPLCVAAPSLVGAMCQRAGMRAAGAELVALAWRHAGEQASPDLITNLLAAQADAEDHPGQHETEDLLIALAGEEDAQPRFPRRETVSNIIAFTRVQG